jgi:hypothetical protein
MFATNRIPGHAEQDMYQAEKFFKNGSEKRILSFLNY